MDTESIIREFYKEGTHLYRIFIKHAESVMKKAVELALKIPDQNPDIEFIKEAAMLHDIGIIFTNAPAIGCNGQLPYICHGIKGYEILREKGLKKHGLVCERHTLMGITKEEIVKRKLPIPERDMLPVTIEEKIICYADCFFSKKDLSEKKEKDIIDQLSVYGDDQVERFLDFKRFIEGAL